MWYLLVVLRLVWTVWPQPGYIHPDEFFQSVEIVAGDVFELEVHQAWEFNASLPIRSIVLPYVTIGPGLYMLKAISSFTGFQAVSAYSLLVLPRFTFTLLNIAMDILLFHMASHLGLNAHSVLILFSTSYVTLVYLSRTFSNTLEAFLFIFLMSRVVLSKSSSGKPETNSEDQTNTLQTSTSDVSNMPKHSENTFCVSLTVVAGIFNRPTFVTFALVPYLYWILEGQWTVTKRAVQKLILSALDAVVIMVLFMACDSVYFGSIDIRLKQDQVVGIKEFVQNLTITPLNFLLYNTEASNLAEHGLHPRVTHLCVNAPLLFAFLALFAVQDMFKMIHKRRKGAPHDTLFLLAYFVPVCLLSVFPHQEPRFLLPLLCPLALLYSHRVFGERSRGLWKVIWIVFNLVTGMFYGNLHQGGIIPAMQHFDSTLQLKNHVSMPQIHLIFQHTYMPPRYLLAIPAHSCQDYKAGWRICDRMNVHDLKGSSSQRLTQYVEELSEVLKRQNAVMYLLTPATLHDQVEEISRDKRRFTFDKLNITFGPHISTENLPKWKENETIPEAVCHIMKSLVLNVYAIKFDA